MDSLSSWLNESEKALEKLTNVFIWKKCSPSKM